MAEKKLEGCRVAILATDLFEEAELIEPRKALQEAGAKITVIAPKAGEIQAVKHDTKTQMDDSNSRLCRRLGCFLPGKANLREKSTSRHGGFREQLIPTVAVDTDRRRSDEDFRAARHFRDRVD